MTNPSEMHMKATKIIFKYARGALNLGIHYYTSKSIELVLFSDSDWGDSLDEQNSTSGNCVYFGSYLIMWSSKRQCILFLSYTKAEYVVITSTGTQELWLINVREEIEEKQIQPTTIFCDNMSAIKLAKNLVHHRTTNHFYLKYLFIQDLMQKN